MVLFAGVPCCMPGVSALSLPPVQLLLRYGDPTKRPVTGNVMADTLAVSSANVRHIDGRGGGGQKSGHTGRMATGRRMSATLMGVAAARARAEEATLMGVATAHGQKQSGACNMSTLNLQFMCLRPRS